MKRNLAAAYSAKRRSKPQGCDDCMEAGGKCYAHGGEVEAAGEAPEMAPAEMVDQDLPDSEDSSMSEMDMPESDEGLSLAASIMRDRKRMSMAKGGMVEADELDAPEEDGRDSRGLNLEPVHTMEDPEHDTSDASLVSKILMDRKKRRAGM